MADVLLDAGGWLAQVPEQQLTEGHLVLLRKRARAGALDVGEAAGLVDGYRVVTGMLHQVLGCDGFSVGAAVNWVPDARGVGEPEPQDSDVVVNVFGRFPGELVRPVPAMSVARPDRVHVTERRRIELVRLFREALARGRREVQVAAPDAVTCDGCAPEVLRDQERWRRDGVRVIRPRKVLIDSQVLILPVRHVASLRDLTAPEVRSLSARLVECLAQFREASGCTGLSCFANDGVRSRQETPHVHLHVYGRSRDEEANPFDLLRDHLAAAQSV